MSERLFTDALGQAHGRAGADARIVSLVPSITELLYALGLGPQVVGRTGFCIHPRAAVRGVPKLGGTKDVDMAALIALEPTHVIVNIDENTRPLFDELKTVVPQVIVTHPNDPRDNLGLYQLLGGIFDRDAPAQALAEQFEERLTVLNALTCGRSAKRVVYLIWREPWMAVAADTYIGRMLALLNWTVAPCRSGARYPQLDDDELRTADADFVLLSSEPYPFRDKHLAEVGALCPQATVRLVDGEMLSWYGSRAIPGLDYLAALAREYDEQAA